MTLLMTPRTLRFFTLTVLCLWSTALQAGDIFRWVDDQGKTQVSDVVPERYRDTATRISSKKYELTAEQKADARGLAAYEAQRAADDKASEQRAQALARSQEREQRTKAEQDVANARSKATAPDVGNAPSQCAAQWRRYNDSVACFARFAIGNAGAGGTAKSRMRPEAYQVCTDVLPPACPHPGAL